MMYDWEVIQGKTDKKMYPFPRWSKTHPEENLEWKTLYSDSASGQSPYGGWKKAGLQKYADLVKMMVQVRCKKKLCLKVDTEVKDRLFNRHLAYWNARNNRNPQPEALSDEEAEVVFEQEEGDDYETEDEEEEEAQQEE